MENGQMMWYNEHMAERIVGIFLMFIALSLFIISFKFHLDRKADTQKYLQERYQEEQRILDESTAKLV